MTSKDITVGASQSVEHSPPLPASGDGIISVDPFSVVIGFLYVPTIALQLVYQNHAICLFFCGKGMKEANVLFNGTLNTFY